MDESWYFLKEAPESELALVRKAGNMSSSASVEVMVHSILITYGLGVEDSYEEFIDKQCEVLSLSIEGLDIENKETKLLETFLFDGILKMNKEQLRSFATTYGFSNLNAEKLIREVRVRMVNSSKLKSKLSEVVFVLFHGDTDDIVPLLSVDATIVLEKEMLNNTVGAANLDSTLIMLNRFHRSVKLSYVKHYLDLMVSNYDLFHGNEKKAYLLIMLNLCRLYLQGIDVIAFDEISSYLDEKEIIIPSYLTNKLVEDDFRDLANHILEKVFPCDARQIGYYESTSCLAEGKGRVAFFDYRFPYTSPLFGTYFAMPIDKDKLYFNKLYLLFFDKNPDDCLVEKKQLVGEEIDCAVVSYRDELFLKSSTKAIYTEDSMIEGWKNFFHIESKNTQSIGSIVEFLTIFVSKNYKKLIPKFMEIINGMDDNNDVLRKFKFFMRRISDSMTVNERVIDNEN